MNRDEVVALYREIMSLCPDMSSSTVNLTESKPDDPVAQGYQIRIKTSLDNESAKIIEETAKKYSLTMKEENGEVIIFKPKIS